MINILIYGIGGKMGKIIQNLATQDNDINIVAGVDKFANPADFNIPVYTNIANCKEKVDVVIDFSRPEALFDILSFCAQKHCGAVLCTTGYTKEQYSSIDDASKIFPVFLSANMSLGINIISNVLKQVAPILKQYDIEIIEKHHNQKVDAPSGTALLLADSINEVSEPKKDYVFGRYGNDSKRCKNDLTLHAVRGGTIVGEHEVIFAGTDEVITFSHSAYSKTVFANGALNASKYIFNKINGKFNMNDLINKN